MWQWYGKIPTGLAVNLYVNWWPGGIKPLSPEIIGTPSWLPGCIECMCRLWGIVPRFSTVISTWSSFVIRRVGPGILLLNVQAGNFIDWFVSSDKLMGSLWSSSMIRVNCLRVVPLLKNVAWPQLKCVKICSMLGISAVFLAQFLSISYCCRWSIETALAGRTEGSKVIINKSNSNILTELRTEVCY